jgi:hypothetical protein
MDDSVLYAVCARKASQSELAVSRHADGLLPSDMTISGLSWVKSEEDKIMAITKMLLKTHEAKWPLEFIGRSKS